MSNIAILVGNTEYGLLPHLECCSADIRAMEELIAATEKFDTIETIENANASDLKTKLRATTNTEKQIAEVFFYFTGHGFSHEEEFFYCASDFDSNRPNETGLSTSELHTLLRLANAETVIKVVDACNSGTHLIKSDVGLNQANKDGFNNLIQISSCLASQTSLTGHPLSLFTSKFLQAALSKSEGVVHYMDVIASLRDQFIGSSGQIPFFVQQGTGREEFVDEAKKFDALREIIAARNAPKPDSDTSAQPSPITPPSLVELLTSEETGLATPELMNSFVGTFFDDVKSGLSQFEFPELFQLEFSEHNKFLEPTAERFIVDVMANEKRPDNFVTAERSLSGYSTHPFSRLSSLANLYSADQTSYTYDLELNCEMARTQLRITLTPKFSALQRIVLVITCAPSLETCYVFEIATQHLLFDFGKYDEDGRDLVKRWYKFDWNEDTSGVAKKILQTLGDELRKQIDNTTKRLTAID